MGFSKYSYLEMESRLLIHLNRLMQRRRLRSKSEQYVSDPSSAWLVSSNNRFALHPVPTFGTVHDRIDHCHVGYGIFKRRWHLRIF